MAKNSIHMTSETSRSILNTEEFKLELGRYCNAAIGIIMIKTREPVRCRKAVQKVANSRESQFKLWACNKGWQTFPLVRASDEALIDTQQPINTDNQTMEIGSALRDAVSAPKSQNGIVYVMYDPHHWFAHPVVQQWIKNFAVKSRDEPVRMIMIVPETAEIPAEIEDDIFVMDFAPPSHAELEINCREFLESLDEEERPNFHDDEINLIVQNGLGMTITEFETAIALAVVTYVRDQVTRNDVSRYVQMILQHKTEVIKKTDILELLTTESMDNVGGFDLVKKWLEKRAIAYTDEAKEYGIEIPKGILCVGVPGSGKTLFGKATASMLGVPFVKMDIGKAFGKMVGESEARMRLALKVVQAMAPCVLLVDEIDKGFGGLQNGGGDGGTSMRVLGTFLSWMQDRDTDKHPVFVVMTANNVIGLPPELMRRGRVDEIYACSFPGIEERADILRIHLTKRGHQLPAKDLRRIAAEADKYVGSELEGAVQNAILEAFHLKLKAPTAELVIAEIKAITPLSKAFADKVNVMNEWAKNNAKPASSNTTFEPLTAAPKIQPRKVIVPKGAPIKGSRDLDS